MKGPEGQRIFTGADNRLMYDESLGGEDVSRLFNETTITLDDPKKGIQLTVALHGEGFIDKIDKIDRNAYGKLTELGTFISTRNPHIARLIPQHLTTDREKAAFLARFAWNEIDSKKSLN